MQPQINKEDEKLKTEEDKKAKKEVISILRELKKKGYTQQVIAIHLGVTQGWLSRIKDPSDKSSTPSQDLLLGIKALNGSEENENA